MYEAIVALQKELIWPNGRHASRRATTEPVNLYVLLVAERDHRIDLRSSPRWEVAGDEAHTRN
jgi:hypothetical protein